MAAEWRMTWGDTFFSSSAGHVFVAIAVYLAMRRSRASRLSGVPRRVMNSGSAGSPPRSSSQPRRTVTVAGVSGVMRCFLPFPRQLTCAPVPRWTSPMARLVSSVARSPVWQASISRARSRRPVQVARSGAASRAVISSSVR